ncbi:UshA-like (seleno)protein [Engelhardtia mirabilis]|uniref:Perchlorate reductase subunit gamma n=1 Tax=Engelhardtia mirabilis TaxID=2528011 RepID=A0A518BKP5_9BACT|nr:Perchlorate reductase subunit gamma precursor [Planctomycetes bacterium Pla133]QDV01867.1 Perchlorate reductase subunit gamma precursor [Planctomycetes bacterium Pla86]
MSSDSSLHRLPVATPSGPSRAARAGVALTALAATGALVLGSCDPRQAESSDLRLLYTATLDGYIEPCGCTKGKTGGIDRIAAAVRANRADHPGTLFIDAGDLFSDALRVDDLKREQLLIKADEMLGMWAELGCEAMGLGDLDLALGVEALQDLSARHGVPILCANLFDADGQRPFEQSIVLERGGLKIGVFSLLGRRMQEAYAKDNTPEILLVQRRAAELGLEVGPWHEAAAEVIADLAPRTDVLLCASHLGVKVNRQLAEAFPELDLVFGGHTDNEPNPMEIIAGTPVTSSGIKGSRLNRVDFWFDSAYRKSEGRGELADVSRWIDAQISYDVTANGIVMVEGRRASLGEAEWRNRATGVHQANRGAQELIEELGEMPGGGRFAFTTVPLAMSAHRDERALQVISNYHDRLDDHWQAGAPPSNHPTPRFVGPESCYGCHTEQYEFWKSTQHSRAFATLAATRQHTDVECIGCHTVGWEQARGFDHPAASAGFENVQCAACHGAGGPHVKGGLSYFDRQRLIDEPPSTCAKCHNDEHDPRFKSDFAQRLPRVTCPPMPLAGGGSGPLLASYREGAELAESLDAPDWGLSSQLWLMAGETSRSLDAARTWSEQDPRNQVIKANLAEKLVVAGEYAESLVLVDEILDRQPSNGRAWTMKAAALLGLGENEASLEAGREAYSIMPDDWTNARLLAEAAAALGDRMGAVDLLRAHLERRPMDEEYLGALLASLLGTD